MWRCFVAYPLYVGRTRRRIRCFSEGGLGKDELGF